LPKLRVVPRFYKTGGHWRTLAGLVDMTSSAITKPCVAMIIMRVLPAAAIATIVLLSACGRASDKPAATPPAGATTAAKAPSAPALGAGEAMLPVRGGRIWYKRSGSGTGTPMVLVHGGPGAGSYYMKAFEDIGDDRPIIRYDQLGAGKSDRLTDSTLMNIPRFVEELDSLRRALGIQKWFVNGHSWGTVLALEYYKAHPEHVAGIVFGGSVFDWRAYARATNAWVKQMSDSSQRAIAAWKKGGSPDNPAFKAATDEFYAKYVWRHPVKADQDSSNAQFGQAQYVYMQGAYEYVVTGTLKNYDARADLPKIKVPVLSTTGEFDEVGPNFVEAHARLIPGAKFIKYPGAGHVTSWDARDANVKDVREFLRSVDNRQ
jgi:proline iminopeptidase